MIKIFFFILRGFLAKKGHFLILFQNNNELRATGGFITALVDVGFFKIKMRKVFGEMDKHPIVKGPKPLMEMLSDGYYKSWTFRDANFFPEFNESAEHLVHFYQQVFPRQKVDSILAVNFGFVEKLLGCLGSVQVKGQEISSNELFYFLSAEVSDIDRHDLGSLAKRKEILSKLARRMILACVLRFWTWPSIFRLIRASFETRDLQIHQDDSPANFFYEKGQDFLGVIESNFLGLKSNRYIGRSVFHDSLIGVDGKISTNVRVVWEHRGVYDRPLSGSYRAYVRLYLPSMVGKISALASSPLTEPTQTQEGDFTIFAFKLFIKPGEKFVLNLNYVLAAESVHDYRFKYFKQSGVSREGFHKSVRFPKNCLPLPPEYGCVTENLYTYDLASVEKDLVLTLKSRKANHAPRILKHELISPDTILVRFSEAVVVPKNMDGLFTLNKKGGKKRFAITKVTFKEDATVMEVRLKDLPQKEEEFYTLTLKGIKSRDGALIHPNPRSVTVVYRSRFFKKN